MLTFGKYEGKTLEEVVEFDPDYIIWLYDNVKTVSIPDCIMDAAFESQEYGGPDWWDMF